MATTKKNTEKNNARKRYDDRLTWKKGDVQIYKSVEDFKKKNPKAKIVKP